MLFRSNNNYGFLFSNGTSARFLQEFYKNKTGVLGSLILVWKLIGSSFVGGKLFRNIVKNEIVKLHIDGKQSLQHGSVSVSCATVEKMPLGRKLFPGADEIINLFKVVSVNLAENELVRKFSAGFLFRPEEPGYGKIRFCTSHLSLEYESPQLFTLDGELYHDRNGKLDISLGPRISFVIL